MITQGRLRELLNYDPSSGIWRWVRPPRGKLFGSVAGTLRAKGYRAITIDGRSYSSHRLAWFWMTGHFPTQQIDHINGIRWDNRWENLRAASCGENSQNRAMQSNNTSGYIGVSAANYRKFRVWRAKITVGGKTISLGYWETPQQAAAAYSRGKAKYHIFCPTLRNGDSTQHK